MTSARDPTPNHPVQPRRLELAANGMWFRSPAGDVVPLVTRKPLARILAVLACARLDSPGRAVPRADLIAAGWPGERILPRAARNRLGVALTTLRKLGLEGLLVRQRDGYLLSEELTVVVAEGACADPASPSPPRDLDVGGGRLDPGDDV